MKNLKMFIETALSIILCLTFQSQLVSSQTTFAAPVNKDEATSLYTITLADNDRYVIDTIALYSWQRCPTPTPSSFFRFSAQCMPAQSKWVPYCSLVPPDNNSSVCFVTPANPVAKTCTLDLLVSLNLTVSWADDVDPTATINTAVSCAPESLFQSLPAGIVGLASFSSSPLSLQVQFSTPFPDVESKFAMCLPRTGSSGVIFFGGGPYNHDSKTNFDAPIHVSYVPLLTTSFKPTDYNYALGPKALSVAGKSIPMYVPASSIFRMVTISTTLPYTYIKSDIYDQFIEYFTEEMKDIPRVEKVEPFSVCYNTTTIGHDGVGLDIPKINLEFDSGIWTFHGSNTMKYVRDDVACLAILEGWPYGSFGISLGTFQMEENLLVFEAFQNRQSMFGFSSSLNHQGISCGNLNFRADV